MSRRDVFEVTRPKLLLGSYVHDMHASQDHLDDMISANVHSNRVWDIHL